MYNLCYILLLFYYASECVLLHGHLVCAVVIWCDMLGGVPIIVITVHVCNER